jgi:DNA primase
VLILEVLRKRGHEAARLTRATFHFHCPLPGHEDRRPSFQVKDNRWRCFSQCATGGDVIDLVVALDHCSKAEAIESLARSIGLGREATSTPSTTRAADARLLEDFVQKRGWSPTAVREAGLHVVRFRGEHGPWAKGTAAVRFPYRIEGQLVWYQDRALDDSEPPWLAPKGSEAAVYNADGLQLADER